MHYKNGREAVVGDMVVGTTFNTNGRIVAGTLVTLTPGADSCSAMVGYLELIKQGADGKFPPSYTYNPLVRIQGTESHGTAGVMAITYYKQDYTECKNLLHAEDAWKCSIPD